MRNLSTASAEGKANPAQLRCRPGDLARIAYSWSLALAGRTVIVEKLRTDGSWNVTLLGEPAFGLTRGGIPIIGDKFSFHDSSLVPLRGDHPETEDVRAELISHSLEALRNAAHRVPLDFERICATFPPSEVH
ncbi:hypothetical protein [Burkholderia sp. LA-2-3-30-S1-D2]|uniref:hypothetical protein n=1 Tax=Burkholderia sp. LA-2-3-30-S1-D2 TaxID=1637862 RepID=UPI0009E75DDD|nr:hypothetical protein [Burkholderia sp. LA-2-3-30-S1-D2]